MNTLPRRRSFHSIEVLENRIAPATFHWNVNASGDWNVATNWFNETTGSVSGFPNAIDDIAKFEGVITANRTITIPNAVTVTVGELSFNDNNVYTIANAGSGRLILNVASGSADISNPAGNGAHIISTILQLNDNLLVFQDSASTLFLSDSIVDGVGSRSLTKAGTGTLELAGDNGYTGTTTVNSGTLRLNFGADNTINGNLVVGDGNALNGAAFVTLVTDDQIDSATNITVNSDGTLSGNVRIGGTFLTRPEGSVFNVGNQIVRISYRGGDGNDVVLQALAPAGDVTLVNKTTATLKDVDGDLVTVKVSKGELSLADFTLGPTPVAGAAILQRLNLSDDGTEFAGATVTITAKRTAAGGDGFVNIGHIQAAGLDLGKVTVAGDLGQIDTRKLAGLTVGSLGRLGLSTQAAGGSLVSSFDGAVGPILVRGDIVNARIDANDIVKSVTVNGSVIGTEAQGGRLEFARDLLFLKIGRHVIGYAADAAGVDVVGKLGPTLILGSVIAFEGNGSANIVQTGSTKSAGPVTIGGSVIGGSQANSGLLSFAGNVSSLTIGGDLIGGTATRAGAVFYSGAIGKLNIRGNILGGAAVEAGVVLSLKDTSTIGSIAVGRSILGGTAGTAGIIGEKSLGAIKIGGEVAAYQGGRVLVQAAGFPNPQPNEVLVIKSLTIGGSVVNAFIGAGFATNGSAFNADVAIGPVLVKGDWVASNLVAGINDVSGGFGSGNDVVIGGGGNATIASRIASITIAGQILGTDAPGDSFAFTAQQIGSAKVGLNKLPLQPIAVDDLLLSPTLDVRIRELS